MIPPFLVPWAIRLAVVLGIALSGYLGYSHIKDIGYKEAEAKYTLIIKDYESIINKKIDSIETLSTTLVAENRENSTLLAQDMQAIKDGIKKKPLVIVKDGECNPSANFSDSFSKINQRANQSIKDKKP